MIKHVLKNGLKIPEIRNLFKTFHQHKTNFSTNQDLQKSIQVCVLGASTKLGSLTSFLLKQNPLVSTLHLHGCSKVDNLALDLNFCDTKCFAQEYIGDHNVSNAIKGADVILLLSTQDLKEDTPLGERIMKEGKRLESIVKECTVFAPRAILISCIPPVSVTTAICANIFKKTHFYHPGRIVGSAAVVQVKANTLLARYNDLDPHLCHVPLVGGPDIDLAVPLFSRAKPVEAVGKGPHLLTAKLRGVKENDFPQILSKPNFIEKCDMAEAYALNSLVSTIALGICGDPKAFANVYVRSNVLQACGHIVSTVRFARGGVVHNFGIPELTKFELDLLEKATLQIKEREKMAEDFLEFLEKKDDGKLPAFKEKEEKEKQLLKETFVR